MTGTLVLTFVPGDGSNNEVPVLAFVVVGLALRPVLLLTHACCWLSLDGLATGGWFAVLLLRALKTLDEIRLRGNLDGVSWAGGLTLSA